MRFYRFQSGNALTDFCIIVIEENAWVRPVARVGGPVYKVAIGSQDVKIDVDGMIPDVGI